MSYNSAQEVCTQGATFSFTCYVAPVLSPLGNYSLNILAHSKLPTGLRTLFNTPKHKFNVGASGTVLHNLG